MPRCDDCELRGLMLDVNNIVGGAGKLWRQVCGDHSLDVDRAEAYDQSTSRLKPLPAAESKARQPGPLQRARAVALHVPLSTSGRLFRRPDGRILLRH